MNNISLLATLLTIVCGMYRVSAGGYMPIVEPEVEVVIEEVPTLPVGGYPKYGRWGYPQGWGLSNSEVLTGGSAKASNNVLAGGSTSADNGQFTKTKTHSRTRGDASVGFGMIGGDGGDNYNSQKGGIEYNGGGIVNFLSKVQGPNNQGIAGSNDLWQYLQGGYKPYSAGGYLPGSVLEPELEPVLV